jgi:MarR family transcriptional regulator, 2-MHQ and catechol-resistance regulon repressor
MQVNNGMEIYRALSDLARRYQFRSKEEVCCYGLTVSQCYALQELHDFGKMPSSDLALRLSLDLSSTTRLVDQLVRKKLAVRTKKAEDARIREIEITESGRRLISRIQNDLSSIVIHALKDFPDEVLNVLPNVLQRLTKVLNECAAEPQNFVPIESMAKNSK